MRCICLHQSLIYETTLNNSRAIQERKQAKKGMKVYPKLLV
ncbi:hypothetical protein FLAVO9R_70312 [Flavobacterium sp. 9R]|nr:hypothetical protein FLAVO9R_70312 [Flavobacterium sp. 9R]